MSSNVDELFSEFETVFFSLHLFGERMSKRKAEKSIELNWLFDNDQISSRCLKKDLGNQWKYKDKDAENVYVTVYYRIKARVCHFSQ